jgi:predicted RecB family nuclease
LKAHLVSVSKRGNYSEYLKLQRRLKRKYSKNAVTHLRKLRDWDNVVSAPVSILNAIGVGHSLILDVTMQTGTFSFELDALTSKRDQRDESTELVPVLFVFSEKPSVREKLLLAMAALLLERLTGIDTEVGLIIYGRNFRSSTVSLTKLKQRAFQSLQALGALDQSGSPTLYLNDHCRMCQFEARCLKEAKESDDLSLLRGISQKEIARLNKRGIFTVTQYSYTYRARRRSTKLNPKPTKHERSINALAMRTNSLYVADSLLLPSTATQIFLDFEGIPDRDFYYLLGIAVVSNGNRSEVSFWADDHSSEKILWRGLTKILEDVTDFSIFHYGSYDRRALMRLASRHGSDSELTARIEAAAFNVLSAIYGTVYFPCSSNDLKSVAGTLGVEWKTRNSSGLDSIAWRDEWGRTGSKEIKSRLVEYNRDDVVALERVVDCLYRIQSPSPGLLPIPTIQLDEMKTARAYNLIRKSATIPGMELINRRSYFDYQRQKVYIRTPSKNGAPAIARSRKSKAPAPVDRIVQLQPPKSCPDCGVEDICRHGLLQTVVHDLSFTRHGVKRSNLRYKSSRFRCRRCKKAFNPAEWRQHSSRKYGHGLMSWTVYHNLELRQTGGTVVEGLRAIFGYKFHGGLASRLKRRAAEYYSVTYAKLKDSIRSADVVYADETPVKIQKGEGYVWVFANNDTVIYQYSDTREAELLKTTLKGFDGVLVSDFYAAYGSISCAKQKCLIHLFRDLNSSLLRNPFDDEIKLVTQSLTSLMIPIVETIDRFGLRRRYLKKHSKMAGQFLDLIRQTQFTSPDAVTLTQRIIDHSDSLFTFLEHDNVAWSNNNAEHAVKRFAMLRNVIGNVSTASGIQEYLVLLSICETLRRRNVSFLEFLRSESTDLMEYVKR